MTYKLKFLPKALKEWKKLGHTHTVREQLKSKLKERLRNPHAPLSSALEPNGGRKEES